MELAMFWPLVISPASPRQPDAQNIKISEKSSELLIRKLPFQRLVRDCSGLQDGPEVPETARRPKLKDF